LTSKTWPDLRRAEHLGVTVLADDYAAVCRQLVGPVDHRFDDVSYSETEFGAVTLNDGLAWFDCTIYREVDAGDHVLVLFQLHGVEHVDPASVSTPLVFHRSAFGRLEQPAKTTGTGVNPPSPGHRSPHPAGDRLHGAAGSA
jgi:flavin reductase (DIM6/NTAB) family NADH-FMN oxidoreductase RutF